MRQPLAPSGKSHGNLAPAAILLALCVVLGGCGALQPLVTPQSDAQPVAMATPAATVTQTPAQVAMISPSGIVPIAATAVPAAGQSVSQLPSVVSQIAQFVADIASSTPQNNSASTTPLVQIARPVAQIGASIAGPPGEAGLNLVGLIASAIAGIGVAGAAGVKVAAAKNKTIASHKQVIHELSAAVPATAKLSPLAQTTIATTTAGA